jgi:hypothetical protein
MKQLQSILVIIAPLVFQWLGTAAVSRAAESSSYQVKASALTVTLTDDGTIAGAKIRGHEMLTAGKTAVAGCIPDGAVKVEKDGPGGIRFTRTVRDTGSNRTLTVVEEFKPAGDSVRWEVAIDSDGAPWVTDVITELNCAVSGSTRFWTAWSDPEHLSDGWRDPLVLKPFSNTKWPYSNLTYGTPELGDFISIPLATVAQPNDDTGLSLVLSPESTTLEPAIWLETDIAGTIRFTREKHAFGRGKPLRFAMDLVAHEADWRGGLRWMTVRYPRFFDPPNPKADLMAGCGAYSGYEGPLDVAHLKAMAFSVNWKLSDDFPYMGMFIPPVKDANETWERSCDEEAPPGKGRTTCCRQMDDYGKYMKANGFYVLDYFNVTEFGKNMSRPLNPAAKRDDPELWKDPIAFMHFSLPNAALVPHERTCYKAVVTDCGDPVYQKYILEQAKRDIEYLPDTDGICIDRMDWLRRYNYHADDGLSWVNGGPARPLLVSWKELMEKLGPLMHEAGKVIFANPLTTRLDLMSQVDGIYSEYGESGGGLNSMALIANRKTAITWTGIHDKWPFCDLKPDPDSYFQRHLYMGVYPTAPFPFNNHAIRPDPQTDAQYATYGPLLEAMRGKKWVLAPHCLEVAKDAAKVNLFEVPDGYALPVILAGEAKFVDVTVRNVRGLDAVKCVALHPGGDAPVPIPTIFKDGSLALHVPIRRGCAMVLLRR